MTSQSQPGCDALRATTSGSEPSAMVERVAAALRKVPFDMPGAGGLRGQLHLAPAQAVVLARAAIEAMREPTSAMLGTGAAMCDEATNDEDQERARSVFVMMIDAALAEGTEAATTEG